MNDPDQSQPDPLACAEARIRAFIARSAVPEDPAHAENTLQWLLRLAPEADTALRLAALGHDIDRAAPDKVQRGDYADYDAFKAAHAEHGAHILERLLRECGVDDDIVAETCRLVRHHETGGDPRADLLRDADSLSYFDTNLPLYLQREGPAETLRRCIWGVRRLSSAARERLRRQPFPDPVIADLVRRALAAA